jgi:hypothetical protein
MIFITELLKKEPRTTETNTVRGETGSHKIL